MVFFYPLVSGVSVKRNRIADARIVHLEGKSLFSDLDRVKNELVARRLFLFKTRNKIIRVVADSIFSINALLRFIFFCIIKNTEKINLWLFVLKRNFYIYKIIEN
jgi:hypothetical protein